MSAPRAHSLVGVSPQREPMSASRADRVTLAQVVLRLSLGLRLVVCAGDYREVRGKARSNLQYPSRYVDRLAVHNDGDPVRKLVVHHRIPCSPTQTLGEGAAESSKDASPCFRLESRLSSVCHRPPFPGCYQRVSQRGRGMGRAIGGEQYNHMIGRPQTAPDDGPRLGDVKGMSAFPVIVRGDHSLPSPSIVLHPAPSPGAEG
jgi:hypothetical protein